MNEPEKQEVVRFNFLVGKGFEEKQVKRILKMIKSDDIDSIMKMTELELKELLSECEMRLIKAKEDLENNETFIQLNEDIKTLKSAYKDVIKGDQWRKNLCVSLLRDINNEEESF